MTTKIVLHFLALLWLASSGSAESELEKAKKYFLERKSALNADEHRLLDVSFEKQPTRKPTAPTRKPTKPTRKPTKPTRKPTKPTRKPTKPTRRPTKPTRKPTRSPTRPTNKPTFGATTAPPPQCGTILTSDGSDCLLGPYKKDLSKYSTKDRSCNTGTGRWFSKSYYAPEYAYGFQLTQRCEYQFRTPEGNNAWQTVRDVNTWFEQAASTFQRPDNRGYKVSDDDIIFNGEHVPNYRKDLKTCDKPSNNCQNFGECPEKYCVKVVGPSVGRRSSASITSVSKEDSSSLLYAFSNKNAYHDFWRMMYDSMRTSHRSKIFLTNHFQRCGCESFCYDDLPDEVSSAHATCYVEELCGTRVYQIKYADSYPGNKRASWAKTGTTKVMEWFSECASAQFGCDLMGTSQKLDYFKGSGYSRYNKDFPKTFKYSRFEGKNNVYALGGDRKYGFPQSRSSKTPYIKWSCPSSARRDELEKFGKFVSSAEFMRDAGLAKSVPQAPCKPEVIKPPEVPQFPPPVGRPCHEIDHKGYCMQLPGGTCYIREPEVNCIEVDFVFENKNEIKVFSNVQEWMNKCIGDGASCKVDKDFGAGTLTNVAAPYPYPYYFGGSYGWYLLMLNMKKNGQDVIKNPTYIYYDCESWESPYLASNFTKGAGGSFTSIFKNTYGDLFKIKDTECTEPPTSGPTESPTISPVPSAYPSMAPTVCSESYLDAENLNIALVVDLSYSTYEKEFSSVVPIGDVNGDGKGNTILDAQILAIEDLLRSISESSTLSNANCEIELISFETDAKSHGVWKPLSDSGGINTVMMEYIKQKLRTPQDDHDVYSTNNGFTNFDAALDRSVEYFENKATANRLNLLVFLSDGEPNVRGDGDKEGYCSDKVYFWNNDEPSTEISCNELGLGLGDRHEFCRSDDSDCVPNNPYQDCVRGPNNCLNADAVTQYDSEISRLTELKVERLAIGVGDESNVASGSALWMIDNNPAKDLGVLPIQALSLEELTTALKSLCILNTDPPTSSPSESPSQTPTKSPAPSSIPTDLPSSDPTPTPSSLPTDRAEFAITTPSPSSTPSVSPSSSPTTPPPTTSPTESPSSDPTASPSASPSSSPSFGPTDVPSSSPSEAPSGSFFPSAAPTEKPSKSLSPSASPTATPSASPTGSPTGAPTASPSASPSMAPTAKPSSSPSSVPTGTPTLSSMPTFTFPECYNGPRMIAKDSSDITMCYYDPDMVQIQEMKTSEVTVAFINVWTESVLPEQFRVFTHTNGADAILPAGDGFQCEDEDGDEIDIEGENELTLECYRVADTDQWLAVIDVVITDENICGTNDVSHPCAPEADPILESCSWRILVPCVPEDMCEGGYDTSDGATETPTSVTTKELEELAIEDDDDRFYKPVDPNSQCPGDSLLIKQEGVTNLPAETVQILSQDETSVTISLTQSYTSADSTIDQVYYQYKPDVWNSKCFEEDDLQGGESVEITIECTRMSQVAYLHLWVVDDLSKNVLSAMDNAVIPDCCYPTVPENTPVTSYQIEIKCVTECPEVVS